MRVPPLVSTSTDPLLPATTLVRSSRTLLPGVGRRALLCVRLLLRPAHREADVLRRSDRSLRPPDRARDGDHPGRLQPRHRAADRGHGAAARRHGGGSGLSVPRMTARSEEHTSELQSLMRISYAVFCLKKKNKRTNKNQDIHNT